MLNDALNDFYNVVDEEMVQSPERFFEAVGTCIQFFIYTIYLTGFVDPIRNFSFILLKMEYCVTLWRMKRDSLRRGARNSKSGL